MGIIVGSVESLQYFGVKTIIGGLVTIGLILVINNLFKNTIKNPLPIFILICGVILISTIILLTLAFYTIIINRNWP